MNYGHGHVFPRQDGKTFPCGGPSKCAQCTADERDQLKELCEELAGALTAAESHYSMICEVLCALDPPPGGMPVLNQMRAALKKYQDLTHEEK